MALVGYARVSTTDQSLEVQLQQLRDAGCRPIFSEHKTGTTARTDTRPELAACMTYLREGDTLVITRLDRLIRSAIDFYNILGQLQEKGVSFKVLLQPEIDTETPNGKLLMGVLALVAEIETGLRKLRQREGIDRAKAAGVYNNNAKRNGKLARASRLLGEGLTYKEASEKTGVPQNTLRRRLPGHLERIAKNGSYRDGWSKAGSPATLPPSAAEAVKEEPTPKPPPPRTGLFGRFGRS